MPLSEWQRVYYLDHTVLDDGRHELPYYWAVSSLRYPITDREYRLTWDPEKEAWGVYIRLADPEGSLAAKPGHPGDVEAAVEAEVNIRLQGLTRKGPAPEPEPATQD